MTEMFAEWAARQPANMPGRVDGTLGPDPSPILSDDELAARIASSLRLRPSDELIALMERAAADDCKR